MSCGAKSCSSYPVVYTLENPKSVHASTWLVRTLATARHALQRRRQRRALLELDDRLLNDIGVTRDQARSESRRPPWR